MNKLFTFFLVVLFGSSVFATTIVLEINPILYPNTRNEPFNTRFQYIADGSVIVFTPSSQIGDWRYGFGEINSESTVTSEGICAAIGKKLISRALSNEAKTRFFEVFGKNFVYLNSNGSIKEIRNGQYEVNHVICK